MKLINAVLLACFLLPAALNAQGITSTESLVKKIEADSNNLPALQNYIAKMGFPNEEVVTQFNEWMKKYPKNPNFTFALGEAYYKKHDRKSFELLYKALVLDMRNERLGKMFAIARSEEWELDITRTPNTIDSLKKLVAARPDSTLALRQYI